MHSDPNHAFDVDPGGGHHRLTFAWIAGVVHIDEHRIEKWIRHGGGRATPTHGILRGCDQGCERYVLVAGDDPFAAATRPAEDLELELMGLRPDDFEPLPAPPDEPPAE